VSLPPAAPPVDPARSRTMRAVRGRDTRPEMTVRRLLHRLGYRFRLHRADLPGRPDLAFPVRHKAVFVHGCFWHGHDCHLFRWPKGNAEFWQAKIAGNVERDRRTLDALVAQGWRVLTVWECAMRGTAGLPPGELAAAAARFLISPDPKVRSAELKHQIAVPPEPAS